MTAPAKFVGRSVPRLEDRPLLTGQGRFAADISFPGQWCMRVVRSSIAHGKIKSIDVAAALKLPGVHAVWTAADVAHIPPIPFRLTGLKSLEPYRQPVLAKDVVRYVGEPVALVFAEDAYTAEDAADLVTINIVSARATLTSTEQPGIFDGERTTEPDVIRKSYGDIDAAFHGAHAIVALELSVGRHSGVPMECRGAVARYDEQADILELHGAAKVPHWNRDTLAQMLRRKRESIQLFEGHVGGGFGIRGEIYPEDVLVCAAALKFRQPIKWIEDRREHLIAANHSREQHHRVRAAIDAQGRILGIDDEFFHDNGAYMRTHAATVPDLAAAMLPGPYVVPAYRAIGHIRLTNKTPCGTYRAPGRYESSFVRERLLDAIAEKVGVDRIEIRKRNLIAKKSMPYALGLETLGTDIVYDSGDYAALLDKTLAQADWKNLQAQLHTRRAAGEKVGAGVAMFVEKSGLGPFDTVKIEVGSDGSIEVITGVASLGQGVETAIAQICADALGVNYRNIKVIHGQTNRIDKGMGAFASRVTVMCGEATRLAATKLRAELLEIAAELMQTKRTSARRRRRTNCSSGSFFRAVAAARRTRHASIPAASAPRRHSSLPIWSILMAFMWRPCESIPTPAASPSSAMSSATMSAKRSIRNWSKARSPAAWRRDLAARCWRNSSTTKMASRYPLPFADYLMPTAREIPELSILITEDAPSPLNPLGLKGAGEGGANPVGAAIASAIDDALGIPGAVIRLPISPQRLKAIMDQDVRGGRN